MRRLIGRVAAAVAMAAGTLTFLTATLSLGGVAPAGASTGCGVTLGTPQVLGALGSFIFDVPTIPAVAGQVCNATISVTGTIATSGGTRPTNVNGNGQAVALTVSFLPGEPPPDLFWQWSPHCADPVSNAYRFTASSPSAGTASSMPLEGSACSSFGNVAASNLLSPVVVVADPATYVGMASTQGNLGYWLAQRGGGIGTEGNATNLGMPFGQVAVVGMAAASSGGYWVATADGGVWAYDAPFFGSMGATPLNAPVVGIASTPDHGGYWLVALTVVCLLSATRSSSAPSPVCYRRACRSTSRSWASPRPPTARVIGWWRVTGSSSRSATRTSGVPWAGPL